MGALTHNGEVMQGLPADASQINFDKTGTDLNSTQTENAIKEVNTKVNTNAADIDQLKNGLTNIENVVDVTNTTLSFDRHISDNVYTSEILLNQYGGGTTIINDKKSGDTVIASMRLFLDVNNKSLKVGYYDGTNWQYETIKQFA